MWSMQLAYPPFPAGEHPKATRRMGNKNANSIFSKSKRQLQSPEPKIGVRAAKSRGDGAGQSRGCVGGSREKVPRSEFSSIGQGARLCTQQKEQNDNSQA